MIGKGLKGLLGAFAVLSLGAAPVLAQGAANVVRARLDSYRELGASFKNVNDELRGKNPQPMVLQLSARQIRNVATQQYNWFPAGSGPQAGLKTKALPAIWSNPAGFKAAQDAYARQATAFNAAVASKDVAKMRVAAKSLGATCASCHKQFRAD